jgi:tetratricopeptide (TPR) repeat protein
MCLQLLHIVFAVGVAQVPTPDPALPLLQQAQADFAAGNNERAHEQVTQLIERFPNSPACVAAFELRGDLFAREKNVDEMIAAYEQAHQLRQSSNRVRMDSDGATKKLANYYMATEQWQTAITWCNAWRPGSGCGNCAESLGHERAHNIALCQIKLGKSTDARKTLEASLLDAELETSASAIQLLVDLYKADGELRALKRKLKQAASKSPHNPTAKLGLQKIGELEKAASDPLTTTVDILQTAKWISVAAVLILCLGVVIQFWRRRRAT